MGRHIDVYAGPLSKEDYRHLKAREAQFLIAENEKHFGPVGEDWEPDEDDQEASQTEVDDDESTDDTVGDASEYDDDDIEFVRGLTYQDVQFQLKERGLSGQGNDETLRGRLLNALRDSEKHSDDEDEDLEENGE